MSEFQSRRERREAERLAQQAQWEAEHGLSDTTPGAAPRGPLASDRPQEAAAPLSAPQASQQRDARGGQPSPAAARFFAQQSDPDLDEDDRASRPFATPAPASRAQGVGWAPQEESARPSAGQPPAGQPSSGQPSAGLPDEAPAPRTTSGAFDASPSAPAPSSPPLGRPAEDRARAPQGPEAQSPTPQSPTRQAPADPSRASQGRESQDQAWAAPSPQEQPGFASPSRAAAPQAPAAEEPQRFASRAEWREHRRRQAQDEPHATGTSLSGEGSDAPTAQAGWGGAAPTVAPPPAGGRAARQSAQPTLLGTGASSDPASLATGDIAAVDAARQGGFASPGGADVYGERGTRPATPEPELSTDTASFTSIPEPEQARHRSEQPRATEEPRVESSAPDLTERRTRSRRKAPVIKPPSTAGVTIVTGSQPTTSEGAPVREDNDEWVDEEYVDESELKDPPVKPMTARSVARQEEPLLVGRTSSRLPIIALTIAVGLALAFGVGALIFLLG